ncbi:hypothetical protein ACG04R_06525 [Roseateles sp. BYS78W]|uniref:Lipoprotein n=1 Tax=Pelomonas candidula TaxID=3299025 RepID=A0ABW7H8R8_9BURK
MTHIASATFVVIAPALLSACIVAPQSRSSNANDAAIMARKSGLALAACGSGNVKGCK